MEDKVEWLDYLIIGSGFGGSVSALRLTEKGYKVAVIEKGKKYRPLDFPKTNWRLNKYLWMPSFGLYGIQALTWLKNVFILHGTGVGGGSLVYANNLLMPKDEVFKKKEWGETDWQTKLKPFYDIARKMLGAIPSPNVGISDRALAEIGKEITGTDTFHINDVAIFFGKKPGETVSDPYFCGLGPERSSCTFCGSCMVGCRENAKNTLDKNYLFFAEKFGAKIYPETEAISVKPVDGGYQVICRKVTGFIPTKTTFKARGIVFSGGVMGTIKLLAKCKNKGWLPLISDQLGNYVRTNAEALIGVMARDKKADYSDNIAITSGIYPDENTHLEVVRYNKGSDVMGLLATVLVGGGGNTPRWMKLLKAIFLHPLTFLKTLFASNFGARCSILLVMQTIEGTYLKMTYKRSLRSFFTRKIDTILPPGQKKISAYIPVAHEVAQKMCEKLDAIPMSLWTEALFDIPTTAHIMGGAIMSNDAKTGVIDFKGKLHGYENLYIADGTIIPANLGVNPSLTITALSEYIMSDIPTKPGNNQISLEQLMNENSTVKASL